MTPEVPAESVEMINELKHLHFNIPISALDFDSRRMQSLLLALYPEGGGGDNQR